MELESLFRSSCHNIGNAVLSEIVPSSTNIPGDPAAPKVFGTYLGQDASGFQSRLAEMFFNLHPIPLEKRARI